MAYNAKKKILHRGMSENILSPEGWGKKILPQTKLPISPVKSQMVGH